MMQTQAPTQVDYTKAIVAIVNTLPIERKVQVYEYVLFLQSRSQAADAAQVEVDEALWDAQFAATDDAKLAALIETVEAEIQTGQAVPMFDEQGEFVER
jgi:hypothetical protein